jgi:hypothetical protein
MWRLGVGVESILTGDRKLAIGWRYGSAGQDDAVEVAKARDAEIDAGLQALRRPAADRQPGECGKGCEARETSRS